MSSDEADNKNVEEPSKDVASSADETEEKEETKPKEDKVNNKAAAKKKGGDPPKIKQPAKKRMKTEQAEKESKKEDKKEEKKKAEEKEKEEENDEESAEENDVNHKSVPLLDQPLEISGKRKTKEVQRFKPVEPEEESKEIKIPEGKGKPLGDIERIDFNIQRAKPEDLKLLHRLCFGKPGKAALVKKLIKKFKGFEFTVDSSEFKKKKESVEKNFKKVTSAHLKNVCNIIDIERGRTKDDLIDGILKFLTCPVDSGKKLPGGGRSKRKGVSNKNYEEGEESFRSKKKSRTKKKEAESEGSENEKDDDDDEEEEEEEEKEEEVNEDEKKKEDVQTTEESEAEKEEEEEEKPKKVAKRGKKAADAADKKAPPKKRAAAKKAVEKKSDSEADADGENESEDEEPLAKKAKAPPTDEEIKTYVKSLLEGANLELITMKKVCQDVYAHYPDFDLAHKKDFIKTTVKNLISS